MKNKIYYGDNLEVLRNHIASESVDLCYIDPPFNSKRNYNQIYNNIGTEDKAQAFIDTWTWDSMAEQGLREVISNEDNVLTTQSIKLIIGLEQILGKGSLLAYLVSMTLRIAEIHRVLKPTGSFYLHCDPTASHYLRLILDSLFCPKGGSFQNELIWSYRTGGASSKRFSRKHDVILFYTKSGKSWVFNAQKERSYMMHKYGFKKSDFQIDPENGLQYSMVYSRDVWEIPTIGSDSAERLGYPTQKPEKLLEKIIKASSNEGDCVLDAYCGCGTTIAVAHRLNRKWIGIDITYQSISLILKRLEHSFINDFTDNVVDKNAANPLEKLEINGVPKDFESAVALANKQDDRTRKEFEKWLVLSYSNNCATINTKKGGDGGIDGIAFLDYVDNENKHSVKQVLFSVKSDKVLSPSVVRDLNGTIEREGAVAGILLTLYPMKNLVKECKKYGEVKLSRTFYPKIQVICVDEMLNGKRLDLPNIIEVLKKAEQQSKTSQTSLL
jgi:DNA modification methylase